MTKNNLDAPNESYWCQEHTEQLINLGLDTLELWDDWGVVNDVTVNILPSLFQAKSLIHSTFLAIHSTFSPRDICEMISPDLLHQIIKGAVKDHIVDWVTQWLINTHGKAHANKVLEDIDHW